MPHRNTNLPTKRCPVCNRDFSYRKKWRRCWDEVVYCSERCRGMRSKAIGKSETTMLEPADVECGVWSLRDSSRR